MTRAWRRPSRAPAALHPPAVSITAARACTSGLDVRLGQALSEGGRPPAGRDRPGRLAARCLAAHVQERRVGVGLEVPGRVGAARQRARDEVPLRAGSRARAARARRDPSARRSRPGRRPRGRRWPARPRGCAARADRPPGRRAGRDRPGSGRTCARPRRIITAGAWTPSARYSPSASAGPGRFAQQGAARGCCPRSPPPAAGAPASSASVGARSSCETGPAHAPRREARAAHDQRHARGALEERHLVPEPALAQQLAVIGREDDERVAVEARSPRARRAPRRRARRGS